MSHSPFRIARTARCVAVSDDEQAVSTTMLGPRRSNMYEIRLAPMLFATPVLECASMIRRLAG